MTADGSIDIETTITGQIRLHGKSRQEDFKNAYYVRNLVVCRRLAL